MALGWRNPAVRAALSSAVLCCVLAAPATATPLEDARTAHAQGDAVTAEATLKTLLTQEPDNRAARLLLAEIYLDASQPIAARTQIERATAAGAEPAEVLLPLLRIHLLLGEYEQVLDQLAVSRSLAAPGDLPELKALEGDALNGLNRDGEAAAAYQAALEQDAGNITARLGSARLSAKAGALQEARMQLAAVLETDPQTWQAWELLGRIEQLAGNANRADVAFTRAIATAPVDWQLHYQRGLARVAVGNLGGAEADRDTLAKAFPDFPRLGFLNGRIALARGELGQAHADLGAQVNTYPDDIDARYWLAEALARDERYASAKDALLPALDRAPGSIAIRMLLARCHIGLEEHREAEALLQPLADDHAEARALLATVRAARAPIGEADSATPLPGEARPLVRRLDAAAALLGMGEVEAATKLLRQIVERAPDDKDARLLLVRALLLAGDHAQARPVAEQLLEQYPQDAATLGALAGALAMGSDKATARALYEQAARLDPANAAPLVGLGLIALNEGQLDSAAELSERASALRPRDPSVVKLTALVEQQRRAEHQGRLTAAVQANPNVLFARIELANLLLEQGNAVQAAKVLADAPEPQRRKPELLRLLATAQLAANRPEDALTALQELPPEQLEEPDLRWLRAQANARAGRVAPLLEDLGSLAAASARPDAPSTASLATLVDQLPQAEQRRELRTRLAAAAPKSSLVAYLQARDAFQAGDYGQAARRFSELRREQSDDHALLLGEAAALEADGRRAEAWLALEQWIDAHPEQTRVRLALADSYRRAEERAKAIAHYRAIVDADPEDAVSRNNLAMLLKDDDPDEALALARQAVALLPRSPQMADTLGQVLLSHQDTEAAVEVLRSAYQRSQDPDIGRRYARALAAAGATEEAGAILQRVMATTGAEE